LAVAGIKPAAEANVNFSLQVRAGYVLDLRENSEDVHHIVTSIPEQERTSDG